MLNSSSRRWSWIKGTLKSLAHKWQIRRCGWLAVFMGFLGLTAKAAASITLAELHPNDLLDDDGQSLLAAAAAIDGDEWWQ